MKQYDVSIVGAGFAGLTCAKLLAEQGLRVLVLDRKQDLEKRIHTTGIFVDEVEALCPLPEHLSRSVSAVRLYAPSGKKIHLHSSDKYFFKTTETPKVMTYLLEQSLAAGVEIKLGSPYQGAVQKKGLIEIKGYGVVSKYLLGADGAQSRVAADWGLGKNHTCLLGAEAEVPLEALPEPESFHCFINQKVHPGYIGWAIPGPNYAQVGCATSIPQRLNLKNFLDYVGRLTGIRQNVILGKRGGLIPAGGPVQGLAKGNVILLGDAAGIVSPLTAGGIHSALFYAKELAKAIVAYEKQESPLKPGAWAEKNYPRFRKKLFLRKVFEHTPNWAFNLGLATLPFMLMAKNTFFKNNYYRVK